MKKCDVTVNKKMTINSGNYSSIQPSVSVTIKDTYVEDIEDTYKNLEVIVDILLMEEIKSLSETQEDIQKLNVKKFLSSLNTDNMTTELKKSIQNLSGMVKF